MRLGVFTAGMSKGPLGDVCDIAVKNGLGAVEIGTGNYPGNAHCSVDELLADSERAKQWQQIITGRGLEISALSCHGNPLHPDPGFARKDVAATLKTIRLAERLDVKTIVGFSGCPGGGPQDKVPNWVTCAWPPDFPTALEWQQSERLDPFWAIMALRLKKAGRRIGWEMHPGFSVYNTAALLETCKRVERLLACGMRNERGETDQEKIGRVIAWMQSIGAVDDDESDVGWATKVLTDGVGEGEAKAAAACLGSNFDPSHLWWQGMDPVASLRVLGKAKKVFHFHAKDCRIDGPNTAFKGVLDTMHYANEAERSWIFRTVGYGHGRDTWCDIVSTLRLIGYDDTLSIEHEDSLMSFGEGFRRAAAFLKDIILTEGRGEVTWA